MMSKRQDSANFSGATPEHRQLDALAGHWHTRGRVVASSPEEEIEIRGNDSYEWLPGGYFMLHRVAVSIGEEEVHNLEVIGYDPASDCYPTRFYDHQGNSGTYIATVSDGVWTFATEGARATFELDPSGERMQAKWERMEDGGD